MPHAHAFSHTPRPHPVRRPAPLTRGARVKVPRVLLLHEIVVLLHLRYAHARDPLQALRHLLGVLRVDLLLRLGFGKQQPGGGGREDTVRV